MTCNIEITDSQIRMDGTPLSPSMTAQELEALFGAPTGVSEGDLVFGEYGLWFIQEKPNLIGKLTGLFGKKDTPPVFKSFYAILKRSDDTPLYAGRPYPGAVTINGKPVAAIGDFQEIPGFTIESYDDDDGEGPRYRVDVHNKILGITFTYNKQKGHLVNIFAWYE